MLLPFHAGFLNLAETTDWNKMIRSGKTLTHQQDILSMKCQLISFVSLPFECTECIEAGLEDAWGPRLNLQQIRWSLLQNVNLLTDINKHLPKASCLVNPPKRTSLFPVCCVFDWFTLTDTWAWQIRAAFRLESNPGNLLAWSLTSSKLMSLAISEKLVNIAGKTPNLLQYFVSIV